MNYQIELRHFVYFKVLAEELHFRKAAERLFISQPGLTRQIKQMEEIYRTKLFDRGKRYVKLTEAGEFLKNELDIVFSSIDNIHKHITAIAAGKISSLKLGFVGSAIQTILPQLLGTIRNNHPLMDITLNELSNEAQIEMLLKNELDFGFIRENTSNLKLRSIPILTESFSLVLPKNHQKANAKRVQLEELQNESFILFAKDYSSAYYELVMSMFKEANFVPHVTLRTVNALSIFNLVSQGLGVAIVPTSLKKGYDTDVEFIELNNLPHRTTLYLVWNPQNRNSGIQLFIDILKENSK